MKGKPSRFWLAKEGRHFFRAESSIDRLTKAKGAVFKADLCIDRRQKGSF